MDDLSLEEKCKLVAKLIEQSPPGEVNDVINDIRAIIANDEALMPHVLPALRTYNLNQLHVVEHPSIDDSPAHTSLLSTAAILPGTSDKERYIDAVGKSSFSFDHVTMETSDFEPYNLPDEEETFRSELAKSLSAYTKNHFPAGHSSVSCSQHPTLPPSSGPLTTGPFESSAPPQIDSTVPDSDSRIEEPITDIVEEQIASGDAEPVPTPAVTGIEEKMEGVELPGGLEKVDEAIEELKTETQAEEGPRIPSDNAPDVKEAETKDAAILEEPKVEEVLGTASTNSSEGRPDVQETAPAEGSEKPVAPVEQRKQERVDNPTYTLEIVGNRYNPTNFWTGRWRTRWVVDQAAGKVNGTINVDVHYYEQGNVQLATNHSTSFACPASPSGSQSIASLIVTTISKIETNYHLELNDVYGELGEKAFRALRRALPVTRQKMEWEKVSGYQLGSDLTKARA